MSFRPNSGHDGPVKQLTEVELLMGADAPYYPGPQSNERNVNFLARFLKAMNTPGHPNSDVLHASIWKGYSMMQLFEDPAVRHSLVTPPMGIDSGALSQHHEDLSPELKKKELAHLDSLQKELSENTYPSLDKSNATTTGGDGKEKSHQSTNDFYFESRLKKLKCLAEEAEPYLSQEKALKDELRALRSANGSLFYPPNAGKKRHKFGNNKVIGEGESEEGDSIPPSPESPAPPPPAPLSEAKKDEILAMAAALDAQIKSSQETKKFLSPAGQHFVHYEKLVHGLYLKFGDYAALGEDFKRGQQQQGKYSAYLGEAMESIALSPGPNGGLDQILSVVFKTEKETRDKYNHSLWQQFSIDSTGWFKCCQNLTFPHTGGAHPAPVAPPIANEDGSLNLDALKHFQAECKKHRLPHLVLVDGLKYQTSLGLAGEFDGVVLDILIDDDPSSQGGGGGVLKGGKGKESSVGGVPDILMLIEVKANPPDLVYARAQRERVSNAVKQVLNPPEKLPDYQQQILDAKQKREEKSDSDIPRRSKGPPSFTFRAPKTAGYQGKLPLPPLHMHALATFCADPVRRWIFVSSKNPPPEKGPVYAPLIHIVLRELVGSLAPALDSIILSSADKRAPILQSGTDPKVNQLRKDFVNELLCEERLVNTILPSVDLQPVLNALLFQWDKAREGNPALEPPGTFLKDLSSRGCEDHLVLVTLKEGALRKPKDLQQHSLTE